MASVATLQCTLCPKQCRIPPGASGDCRIRLNLDGELKAVTWGHPVTVHVDPIEKKPLYHFLPRTTALSVATVGCNLHCLNCQNWEISQANPEDSEAIALPPEELVGAALRAGSPSIAYTYTDPAAWYEYALDSSTLARQRGLRNVLVTAGYLNPEPFRRLYAVTDGCTTDLKAFSDDFYRTVCDASLGPVLDGLVLAKALGVWLEVSNLVIPTLNDRPDQVRELARWMARNLGPDTPLHFLGFHPQHRMRNLPPTPAETLAIARRVALEEGLRYVYVGNVLVEGGGTTFCPGCHAPVLVRQGFRVVEARLADGGCAACGTAIAGVWR
jgi:pyruvate formate lyase activating enzyme